jgi:hypothetical protein
MTDDLMKGHDVDGFETFEAGVEGDDRPQGAGVIQGSILKFTNEATWVDRAGERVPADLELVVVGICRVVQKWKDGAPVETRILGPGEKFPDLEKLNNSTPRIEWTEGKGSDGKLRGPWQAQHIAYLLNPATMDRYSWPTGTTGGAIAVRELVDKTKWMRRFRGAHVYPVVTLSDTFMPTRFGGRQRPHLLIKRWITLGADEKMLPAPTQASGTNEPEKPAEATTQAGARTVEAPTHSEKMNDSIPSDEDGSKSSRKALPPSNVGQVTKRGVVVNIAKGGHRSGSAGPIHPHGAE